jgi:predicted outer membrane repeat protein
LHGDSNIIFDSLFDENKASGSGGGVYNDGITVDLHDCLLYGNDAMVDGGALYSKMGYTTFYHNQFENNHAGGYGGAVFADAIDSLSTDRMNQFTSNHAGKDGNDLITTTDKQAKANGGIVGYAITAFLLAVIATIITVASLGAAAPAMAGASMALATVIVGFNLGLVAAAVEYGITELIAAVNAEFDDFRKKNPGIMVAIGISAAILGSIVGDITYSLCCRLYSYLCVELSAVSFRINTASLNQLGNAPTGIRDIMKEVVRLRLPHRTYNINWAFNLYANEDWLGWVLIQKQIIPIWERLPPFAI